MEAIVLCVIVFAAIALRGSSSAAEAGDEVESRCDDSDMSASLGAVSFMSDEWPQSTGLDCDEFSHTDNFPEDDSTTSYTSDDSWPIFTEFSATEFPETDCYTDISYAWMVGNINHGSLSDPTATDWDSSSTFDSISSSDSDYSTSSDSDFSSSSTFDSDLSSSCSFDDSWSSYSSFNDD